MTEKGAVTRSRLLIQKADRADNGVYSCDPTTAAAATIHVHILNGTYLYTPVTICSINSYKARKQNIS